jgi:hypothetical protein
MTPSSSRRVPPDFAAQVEMLRQQSLQRIESIPIAALIWGPAATSPDGAVRRQLKEELEKRGHLANYSEDLIDLSSSHSVMAQQVAHAESHDIVFSIPSTPGSTAEIHDFARIPWLSNKIVAFLNQNWNNGYSNQSLIQLQSTATCQIQLYDPANSPECIIARAIELVSRLQEVYYFAGRRF